MSREDFEDFENYEGKKTITTKRKKQYLEDLINLRKNGPECEDVGICGNLNYYKDYDYCPYSFTEHYAPRWEHFSGSESYPIKSTTKFYKGCLWKGENKVLRYKLIDFLIKTVEEELEGESDESAEERV